MTDISAFRYDGKRALVVGGATGMGAAAAGTLASLGAEVVVMDRAKVEFPVAKAIEVDLADRSSIDRALDQLDGSIHSLFLAAGVADGTPGLMRINFIAHRHIIDQLMAEKVLGRGGAICFISSVAGIGWEPQLATLKEFLATPDYESADEWVQAHEGTDGYLFSKQAINAYVATQAFRLISEGIRVNAILPGPTDTPLARANADTWLGVNADYREATGVEVLTPDEMGNTMVFLNSDAASGISGEIVLVDQGYVNSSMTGTWEGGAPMINGLLGRF